MRDDAEQTRERLVSSGVKLFARFGFEAVSIRTIAADAEINLSMVSYHFGGKASLYEAVLAEVSIRLLSSMEPVLSQAEKHVVERDLTPDAARDQLLALFSPMVDLALSDRTLDWARLALREQLNPSDSFEILDGPTLRYSNAIAGLIALSRDKVEDREDKLLAITLIGQVLVFRSMKTTAARMVGEQPSSHRIEWVKTTLAHTIETLVANS